MSKVPTRPSLWLLVLLLVLAATGLRFSGQLVDWFFLAGESPGNLEAADRIAAASAVFTAFAFVGVVFAILYQRYELQLQQRDQQDLRAEVAQQAFEGTFFQLLRLHTNNVENQSSQVLTRGDAYQGRQAFIVVARELEYRLGSSVTESGDAKVPIGTVNSIYANTCETPTSDFGHYFRNLYHIVKYIDTSALPKSEKRRYAAQVRAQLSQPEFSLLFINGLRRGGDSKFKPLIQEYSMLHEMRIPAAYAGLKSLYRDEAFGLPEPT
jgi:ABC-type multidrug transport system fused ATPase/permease subunit